MTDLPAEKAENKECRNKSADSGIPMPTHFVLNYREN